MEFLAEGIIGKSAAIKRVIELARKIAPTNSTVLITGETGVGKELVAQLIHRLSLRKEKSFVALNCAAIPETLLESELFGHKKGAFTGADADKKGLLEEANGGTVFLDEIGEMPLSIQAKLLRVIENQEIRPVGSNEVKKIDVRIIAATNKDLAQSVRERKFREDLMFRLNVIQIYIPPLRDRKEDIPLLTGYLIKKYSQALGKNIKSISDSALTMLLNYDYPGNIRELENIIQHSIIVAEGDTITKEDLPEYLPFPKSLPEPAPATAEPVFKTISQMEEELIRQTLIKCKGNQTQAARKLGIGRTTLIRKIKKYGI